MTELDVN
jgi:hypothetical protein